jgi:hypothetical protein
MSPTDFYATIKTLPIGQSGFPTKKAMSDATKLNIYTVKTMLGGLVKSGKIRMEGNWYKFNEENISKAVITPIKDIIKNIDNMKKQYDEQTKDYFKIDNGFPIEVTDEQAKDYIEAITEENKHDSIEAYPIKNKLESFTILRWVMLFIGIISAGLLIYYISIYAKENLSNTLAYIRSIVIVTFSFTSFQAIIILFKQVKNIIGYIGISLLFIFWLAVVIFSMLSTIAGQYQLFSGKQDIVAISSTEYNDTINREKELLNNRNIVLNQISPYLKQLSIADEKQLPDIQYRITLYNRAIQKIDDELKTIRDKKVQLSNGKVIEQNNGFYSWLSGILKISSNSLQLFLYILPALFLDLIGPISFSIFLFLRRKNES